MVQLNDSFPDFIRVRRSDIFRIAHKTQGEHTFEDACNEAYIIAFEIYEKKGIALDLYSQSHQTLLLGYLYNKLVKFADKSIRYAVKLDKGWDTEDSDTLLQVLERFFAAPEASNPLTHMMNEEENTFDPLSIIQHSYSQTAAYLILLQRFNWSLELLANHLQLIVDTVRRKILSSSLHMKVQPSLFDGVACISIDFIPFIAKQRCPTVAIMSYPTQLTWQFFSGQ